MALHVLRQCVLYHSLRDVIHLILLLIRRLQLLLRREQQEHKPELLLRQILRPVKGKRHGGHAELERMDKGDKIRIRQL